LQGTVIWQDAIGAKQDLQIPHQGDVSKGHAGVLPDQLRSPKRCDYG
jgi:hypothetical protein